MHENQGLAHDLKDRFLDVATHDLGKLAAILRGLVEVLATGTLGELNPDQLEWLQDMEREAERIQELVSSLPDPRSARG